MTRILIIGGGIAGITTALAMDKAGIGVTVYEAHPDSAADIGAFLTLASNGMLALGQLDAAEAVTAAGFPLTSMRVVGADGAELGMNPIGEHTDPLACYRCLRRSDLVAALHAEAVRRGIEIQHGKRLHALSDDGAGVVASFDDGSTATGDLLVGADGLNSTVRALITPGGPPTRYAGQYVFYGYTTEAHPVIEPARIEMLRGSSVPFGYAVSPAGETYWFARVSGEPLSDERIAAGSPAQWREELLALLRPDNTPAADIVAATRDRLMVTNARDLPEGMTWRSGRALLIGDAAHAAAPATGQGASMAMEDAVVLAKAVRDLGVTEEALDAYEALRRPRVEHNIATSARYTAARTLGQAPPAPRPAPSGDDEFRRQVQWDLPVPALLADRDR